MLYHKVKPKRSTNLA